jgi:hypothetical protein
VRSVGSDKVFTLMNTGEHLSGGLTPPAN